MQRTIMMDDLMIKVEGQDQVKRNTTAKYYHLPMDKKAIEALHICRNQLLIPLSSPHVTKEHLLHQACGEKKASSPHACGGGFMSVMKAKVFSYGVLLRRSISFYAEALLKGDEAFIQEEIKKTQTAREGK